jgi:hypothetical protein
MNTLKIKIPSTKLCRQHCAEGFNSGVKGLKSEHVNLLKPIGLLRTTRFNAKKFYKVLALR